MLHEGNDQDLPLLQVVPAVRTAHQGDLTRLSFRADGAFAVHNQPQVAGAVAKRVRMERSAVGR